MLVLPFTNSVAPYCAAPPRASTKIDPAPANIGFVMGLTPIGAPSTPVTAPVTPLIVALVMSSAELKSSPDVTE